jgi:hypothetical protein
MNSRTLLPLLGSLLLSGACHHAHAFTACVSNNAELESALSGATDAADDDIRLQAGSYQLPATTRNLRGVFRMSGGWVSGCSVAIVTTAPSQITGPGGTADLNLGGNIGGVQLSRLHFSGFREIRIFERVEGTGDAGELRISRSRFSGTRVFLTPRSIPTRVENSVFDGHSIAGLQIVKISTSTDLPDVLVQHNTILQPAVSGAFGMIINGSAPFGQVRVYNNVLNGHTTDVALTGQSMVLRSNHYNTISLTSGATLAAESGNNLTGNPGFASNPSFAPQEPSSALINAGETLADAVNTRDFLGGFRLVGTRPDIGAVESSVNNSSELIVSNTNDTGAGSLRTAITTSNTNPALKTIRFNLSGGCPQTITPATPLPAITRPVLIDGYTQTGSSPNQDARIFDGTVCVVLNGAGTMATGLHVQTQSIDDQMTVKGLAFYGFASEAIRISGPGKGIVSGNLFGTGSNIISNFADSVIRVVDAPGSVIGGTDDADRNVIGLGQMAGVRLESGTARRTVRNNLVGLGRNGTSTLPNAVGIIVEGGTDDLITGNRIADNTSHGVHILPTPVSNRIRITINTFGTRTSGSATLGGNGGNSVRVSAGSEHLLSSNLFANGGTDAVAVLAAARRTLLSSNNYQRNAGLPIDLSPDGVNLIDLDVGQTGANDQQNSAEILSARGSDTQGEIRLRLSSANGTYRIEFHFSSTGLNGAGFPSGGQPFAISQPLVLTCATSNANCVFTTTIAIDNSAVGQPLVGSFITAVVRDEEGNTSEFSAVEQYVRGDNLFKNGFE